MRIARPPRSRIDLIVGRAMRIRRSSVIAPASSCGTLKSTRTRIVLPWGSMLATDFLAMVGSCGVSNGYNRAVFDNTPGRTATRAFRVPSMLVSLRARPHAAGISRRTER